MQGAVTRQLEHAAVHQMQSGKLPLSRGGRTRLSKPLLALELLPRSGAERHQPAAPQRQGHHLDQSASAEPLPQALAQLSLTPLINSSVVQALTATITTSIPVICRLKILREMQIPSLWEKEPQCLKRQNRTSISR